MGAEAGLTHYLHVLRRGWWIIVLTVGLSTGAAVYASMRQTSLYSSSADVFLSAQTSLRWADAVSVAHQRPSSRGRGRSGRS